MLEPKATAWPFAEMLRFGVLASVGYALVIGLILRGWKHFRRRIAINEARRGKTPDPG